MVERRKKYLPKLWPQTEATMAGNSPVMFESSWTEESVSGSQLFGQASMEGCAGPGVVRIEINPAMHLV